MFELVVSDDARDGALAPQRATSAAVSVPWVRAVVEALAAASGPQGIGKDSDAERIDLIRALEDFKNAAAGLQADVTAEFDDSQQAQQRAAGERAEHLGRGVAAQVALARRISPHRARRRGVA